MWVKLDDRFHSHPKVLQAGNAAVGLWVRCLTWTADQTQDGHIPATVCSKFGRSRERDALTEAGLWIPNGDGYQIRDYLDYNPSRAQILAQRASDRERQARWRMSRRD